MVDFQLGCLEYFVWVCMLIWLFSCFANYLVCLRWFGLFECVCLFECFCFPLWFMVFVLTVGLVFIA